jgi:hypothetical protein
MRTMNPLSVWLIFGVLLLGELARAQTAGLPASAGTALLVLPRPGIPVSVEQIEERSRMAPDGSLRNAHSPDSKLAPPGSPIARYSPSPVTTTSSR